MSPETVETIAATGQGSSRRRLIVLISVVVVIVALAIGLGIYLTQVRPMQRTIIKVNDVDISIGYLVRRLESINSTDIFAMMQTLTEEELIRQGGVRLGIEITDEELDEALHSIARGTNESISDAEYNNWYRVQIIESHLETNDFRELWRTRVVGSLIHQMEAAQVATASEQVHLSLILSDTPETAMAAYDRLEEGEAFADVVADVSLDTATIESGGDQGWFPQAALPASARGVFNIAVGEYSTPVSLAEDGSAYAIFLVTDRAASREIDADKLDLIRFGAMDAWLSGENSRSEVGFYGLDWSETYERYTFGSETQAWIIWQLARRGSVTPPNG